jgi:macrolide transport system ATP-binding/permease protein
MRNLWNDLRFAMRTLGKNPGFAVIGIITLALGMAVNTTIFSVINGILLRPLPVPHAEQMTVLAMQQGGEKGFGSFSYPDFVDLREQLKGTNDLFGYQVTLAGLSVDGKGDHCILSRVTNNYFSVLGITPAAGRLLVPTEGVTPGADPVLVLGYTYWQKRFGGDKSVVGKKVEMNGHPITIVGVAPKEFRGTFSVIDMDAYIPLSSSVKEDSEKDVQDTWTKRDQRTLTVMGRLKPGVSIQQAASLLNVAAKRIAAEHPETDKDMSVRIFPEKLARPQPDPDNTLPGVAVAFMILAALVLFVACFNIANVLLVRATVRQREMAIRAALGASRGRLVRQHLTESLLLALLGGGCGLVLAIWAGAYLSSLEFGTSLPIRFDFRPDGRVILFALLAVLLTGLIVGIIPALRVARTNVNAVLHEGGRGSSDSPRRQIARSTLVIAQVAGSLVLMVVAGLFIRSLNEAESIDLGFSPDHVLNLMVDVDQIGYKEARGREFYRELDSRIRALPGVESVAQAFSVPLGYIGSNEQLTIPGLPVEAGKQLPVVAYNSVSPNYFETLRIKLQIGRVFRDSDVEKSPLVAVINQTMAKKFWPDRDAIGEHFSTKDSKGELIEVVGIVQDGKYRGVIEDPLPYFYLPLEQNYVSLRTIQVHTSMPPETMALSIEAKIRELAPNMPVTDVQTMTQALQGLNGFFIIRFGAKLTAALGLLGLALALVGLYSVVSYAATQRTNEIGIRMALGASRGDILKMILKQGVGVLSIGLGLGLLLALVGARAIANLFVGVKPNDPLTFVVVGILLAVIALLACWIPARRATRVDPLVALRYE